MSAQHVRQQIRVQFATLLHQGAVTREDLVSDLLAVGRGVNAPGPREVADAVEICQLWTDIEADFPDKGPPPGI